MCESEMVSLRDNKKIFVSCSDKIKNAKTLLYLHGGPGGGCNDFLYIAHLLSNEFNVISFDQRGVLRSEAITENELLTVDMLVEDIEDLRKIKGINELYLLGHSYGGFLALLYALKYPNNVKAIIYENSAWNMIDAIKTIHKNTIPFIRNGGDNALADKIESVLNSCNDLKELADLQMETPEKYRIEAYYNKPWTDEQKSFYKPFEITDEQEKSSEYHRQKIIADDINYKDNMSKLKDIKVPSLLVRGEYDPVMSKEYQQYFVENTPNGRLKIISDSGHSIHCDAPHEFCAVIKEFIRAS